MCSQGSNWQLQKANDVTWGNQSRDSTKQKCAETDWLTNLWPGNVQNLAQHNWKLIMPEDPIMNSHTKFEVNPISGLSRNMWTEQQDRHSYIPLQQFWWGTKIYTLCKALYKWPWDVVHVHLCTLRINLYSFETPLTHSGLVTPYGHKDLGQHWLR